MMPIRFSIFVLVSGLCVLATRTQADSPPAYLLQWGSAGGGHGEEVARAGKPAVGPEVGLQRLLLPGAQRPRSLPRPG